MYLKWSTIFRFLLDKSPINYDLRVFPTFQRSAYGICAILCFIAVHATYVHPMYTLDAIISLYFWLLVGIAGAFYLPTSWYQLILHTSGSTRPATLRITNYFDQLLYAIDLPFARWTAMRTCRLLLHLPRVIGLLLLHLAWCIWGRNLGLDLSILLCTSFLWWLVLIHQFLQLMPLFAPSFAKYLQQLSYHEQLTHFGRFGPRSLPLTYFIPNESQGSPQFPT